MYAVYQQGTLSRIKFSNREWCAVPDRVIAASLWRLCLGGLW
jgi:hypothetical protein